jgi:thiol-disulfide isomerase/thioredoxin
MENNNSNNSNGLIILGAILIVSLVIGVINVRNLNKDIESLTERITSLENVLKPAGGNDMNTSYDTSMFKEISLSEIEKDSKGKTVVVWLGLETCGYCQAYAPLLAQVAGEYNMTARYVNVSNMTQEDYDVLVSLKGKGNYENFGSSFTGTPFTMIIKDGVIIGGINGYVEASSIRSTFEAAGLKK